MNIKRPVGSNQKIRMRNLVAFFISFHMIPLYTHYLLKCSRYVHLKFQTYFLPTGFRNDAIFDNRMRKLVENLIPIRTIPELLLQHDYDGHRVQLKFGIDLILARERVELESPFFAEIDLFYPYLQWVHYEISNRTDIIGPLMRNLIYCRN